MPNKLNFLDELRAIAQIGINYTKDQYDLDRYQQILYLASTEYSNLTSIEKDEIKSRFVQELGYITPKVGVQAIVLNSEGEILLDNRSDDACWGLPAGWVEVYETPEEAIIREIKEETNLTVKVKNLIKIYSRKPGQFNQPHGSIHLLYICECMEGELKKSFESLDLKYFKIDEALNLTTWHKDHKIQVEETIDFLKGESHDLLIDNLKVLIGKLINKSSDK